MPRLKRRNADPPEGIPESARELYQEQEAERYRLRMQVSDARKNRAPYYKV